MLSSDQKKYFLSLKPDDITAEFIYDNFASSAEVINGKFVKRDAKIKLNETFTLEPKEYFNTTKVLTTVGLFLYNKVIVEGRFEHILGYHNETITAKVHGAIENKLSEALKYDKITVDAFIEYLDRIQWLGLQFNSVFSSSFTMDTVRPIPKIIKERDKLYSENEAKIAAGDIKVAVDIENELINKAKDELKNDPGIDLYSSGARGSFENNYKNMNITKGPVKSQNEWHVIQKNLTDGINKTDIDAHANSYISSQYPKSVGTQIAGYLVKRINAGFQAVTADKPGSDCGTKQTLEVHITDSNKNLFVDRYIVENGKVIRMTNDNINKYVGKTVKLRTVMFCLGGNCKCNTCLGDIYYLLGIENVGLSVGRMATTILNLNMKKFHSASAKLYDIDLNDISIPI